MIRWLVALLAALVGAGMGTGLTAMGLAILFTAIWGPFEGSAAMGGVTVGLPLGGLLGLGLGASLALRFWKPRPDVRPQA
ncbi:MAG: hypothetical protein HQ465_07250 [Rhodospirillales bacterium]|nr:hypothetical protein [Rhodospirillales bacterium]